MALKYEMDKLINSIKDRGFLYIQVDIPDIPKRSDIRTRYYARCKIVGRLFAGLPDFETQLVYIDSIM